MAKRKTFLEVRQEAEKRARDQMLAEVCRVLRHHLEMDKAASALWDAYRSGADLRQRERPDAQAASWYAPFDYIG